MSHIKTGVVYNVFEAVDVISLIKGGFYDDLNLGVGEALKKRPAVSARFLYPSLHARAVFSCNHPRTFPVYTPAPRTMVWIQSWTQSANLASIV